MVTAIVSVVKGVDVINVVTLSVSVTVCVITDTVGAKSGSVAGERSESESESVAENETVGVGAAFGRKDVMRPGRAIELDGSAISGIAVMSPGRTTEPVACAETGMFMSVRTNDEPSPSAVDWSS